jgi:hypothetical protein
VGAYSSDRPLTKALSKCVRSAAHETFISCLQDRNIEGQACLRHYASCDGDPNETLFRACRDNINILRWNISGVSGSIRKSVPVYTD